MSTPTGPHRLPLVDPQQYTPEQRTLVDHLRDTMLAWAQRVGFRAATAKGQPIGPFNALLYNPRMGRAYSDMIGAERAGTTLSAATREIVILTVGAEWQSAYEVYAHTVAARAVGISDDTIAAIVARSSALHLPDDQEIAYLLTRELVTTKRVSASTYERAVGEYGLEGVVELVHLVGIYLTTCALLNTFEVPAPTD